MKFQYSIYCVYIITPKSRYSTVQYGTVRYGTVLYCTVQYSTVQYSTVQCIYIITPKSSCNNGNRSSFNVLDPQLRLIWEYHETGLGRPIADQVLEDIKCWQIKYMFNSLFCAKYSQVMTHQVQYILSSLLKPYFLYNYLISFITLLN